MAVSDSFLRSPVWTRRRFVVVAKNWHWTWKIDRKTGFDYLAPDGQPPKKNARGPGIADQAGPR
jgi:hypothetical protein